MKPDKNYLSFSDHNEWRSWLDQNHTDTPEAWILIQKKHSPETGLLLDEAVEEALCFGWIDSTLHTRDAQSYLLRFSPRKPNSVWSIHNIHRTDQLQAQGRMLKAGLAAVQATKESGEWQAAIARENPDYILPELAAALHQDPAAGHAYQKLPASRKKRYIYWLQSAKKKETRLKRITKILQLLRDEDEQSTGSSFKKPETF